MPLQRPYPVSPKSGTSISQSILRTNTAHLICDLCEIAKVLVVDRNSDPPEIFAGIESLNSHQNSHSPKTKMAADLAAPHLAYFIVLLAPQVGLELSIKRIFNNMQVNG
jgi:hypothetical protein